jgi:hypothetical protein
MHDPPAYVWAIIIAGPTAIAATTCIALYGGAKRAGQGRRRAALLAGATVGLRGGWFTASAVIAGHGWYPNAAVVSGLGGRVPAPGIHRPGAHVDFPPGPGMDASTADMGCSPRTLATERCSW